MIMSTVHDLGNEVDHVIEHLEKHRTAAAHVPGS